ncbi:hypothetical protein L218DRAFT_577441 [Marasmius fiardii PR-910]|nr:hypothetical protein L218DRAFT_577441 [Marasmius fiardii PR-910]
MAEPSQASSTSAHQYILHEARNTTIGHAMFNNVGGNFNQNYYAISSNPLWEAIADVGASHNSEIQVERGRCLPGTRESVLKIIREWKRSGSGSSPVCWLSGAAGVGKSAIALTFAEECEDEGLVASFFFFRSDPKRNNPSSLVLSIAHGLVVTRPHLGPLVNQQITADPRILKATLENQYKKLVLRNLDHPSPSPAEASPDLVIIDGLDECSDPNTQQRVLSIIFSAAQQSLHSPLRFLICSRPEAWIRDVFVSSAYCSLTKHIKLDDSFRSWYDVELYFNQQFRAICSDPRYSQVEFPNPWPSSRVVELLVRIANGQFIYASTVIKFIMTEYTHPIEQLNIILGDRSTGNSDLSTQRPFHELDQLYHTVLCANPDPNKHLVPILAASLLLPNNDISRSPAFIERLLGFPTGTVTLTLRAMHSVVNVNGRLDNMRIYHTSFADFLFDQARSKEFFIDENYQLDFLAQRWLRALQTSKSSAEQETDSELWKHWGDVCSLVDNPTRELLLQLDGLHLNALITGTLRFLQFDGFSAMRCLFRHFRTIACWLYGRILAGRRNSSSDSS